MITMVRKRLHFLRFLLLSCTVLVPWAMQAQTNLTTTTTFANNNGNGTVTFNLQNTNSYDVIITDIAGVTSSSGTVNVEFWYKTTPLSGSPGNISTANGWTQAATGTITGIANSSTTVTQPFLSNMNFILPANTTYAIAIFATSQRYSTISAGTTTISAGGVNLITGTNIGYGGGTPPATPGNSPRGWIGTITFIPAVPCTSPPNGGVATISDATPCTGSSVLLGVTGHSSGTGQTYQWEEASSLAGPWTAITGATNTNATVTVNASTYYRLAMTCSGSTAYSQEIFANVPTPFPGGTYTINSGMPTDVASGGTNFNSFSDFANAVACGIAGPIVVDVTPGVYNERLFLGEIGGTSATNTITINGYGATLNYISTNGSERGIVTLNGTDYVTINNLNITGITSSTSSYAWGVFMTNSADNNTISGCTIIIDSTTTSSNHCPIVVSGSATSATTTGAGCDNITITNNVLAGGYYGMTMNGTTGAGMMENWVVTNNSVRNFYAYGIYGGGTNNALIEGNDIHRMNRAAVTTFGGIYLFTFNSNLKVLRNKIHDPATGVPTNTSTQYGIYLAASNTSAGNENLIANNVIYNFTGAGSQYGLYNSSSGNTRYYYNTVSMQSTGTSSNLTYGFYQTTIQSGIELRNNNIVISRATSGNKVGIYMNSGITGFSSNYNNIYVTGATGTNNIGYSGSLITSMSAWQLATSQDANSVSIDPIFANPATGDLTPTNAILDNLGTPVIVTNDIVGNTRDVNTPDIGAFEFSTGACSGQPIAGTASVPVLSACAGGPVNLTLAGYTIATGINIDWQSSPAGANSWTTVSTTSAPSFTTPMPSVSTDFRAVVTCTNSGLTDYSNVLSLTIDPFYLCYCSPLTGTTLHSNNGNYITNVAIANTTLNSPSSAVGAGGYTRKDYTVAANTAALTQLVPYTANITVGAATYNVVGWIDYDHSGTFDVSEFIQFTTGGTNASATINVPATSSLGLTGFRVRAYTTTSYGSSGACNSISTGYETEDYVITINPAVACAGVPTATGNATSNVSSICIGNSINLNVTGQSYDQGITIQWESSPAGAGTWTPIAGATNPTTTYSGATGDMDFRLAVTCNNPGGGTGYSNTVTVAVTSPQIVSTSPSTICGTGVAILGATPGPGVNVKWYAASTGGAPLATGNTFTTPTISATTTYYAEPVVGLGGNDSLAMNPTTSGTTGNYYHMFMVSSPTGMTMTDFGIKCNQAAGTLTSWDIYYRPDNYQSVPGANTSSTGWTLLSSVTGVPSMGTNLFTTIASNLSLVIPPGATYSFHIAPGSGTTHAYGTSSLGTTVISNTNASLIAGHRGGGLFNCTVSGGNPIARIGYSLGCTGPRVGVTATVTPGTPISVTATQDTICLGGSTTISATSANSNYTYTWTPGGSGASHTVSPATTTTYYVSAFDAGANCTTNDSVIIAVASTAATVTTNASATTICQSGNVTFTVNPLPTAGITFQWEKNTGSGYADIPGATNDTLTDNATITADYRLKMYCAGNLVNTSSPVTVTVNAPAILQTIPGSRCNTGSVSLIARATPGAMIKWYSAATGGAPLDTGAMFTTPAISATTTYYVAAETAGGSTGASPLQITEIDLGTPDRLEIQNVSGVPIDVTGWKVFISDSYTNINLVNSNVQTLSGTLNPGAILTWTDNSATNYWGSNMFWNPGAFPSFAGWAAIMDNNNVLKDVVFWNWPTSNIQGASWTVNSTTITPGSLWNGHGINATTVAATDGLSRDGLMDNNDSADFSIAPLSVGLSNTTMTLPFAGFGCSSTRVPVDAAITPTNTGTGLAAGGTTISTTHGDGSTVNYDDLCTEKVTTIADAAGGNVLGQTTARVIRTTSVQTHNGLPYVPRFFDITPSSSGPATVSLYATQADFNDYNSYVTANALPLPLLPTGPADVAGIANIVITQFHDSANGGTTGPLGLYNNANSSFITNNNITTTWNGNYWTMTFPVTGFSGFFIHSGATPLAISIERISAVNVGDRNRVDWKTGVEENGVVFEVERSLDGSRFSRIGAVNAKGQASAYSFWDNEPVAGVNYYRIKAITLSGSYSYSEVVSAVVRTTGSFAMEVYPNPAGEFANVRVYGATGSTATITVTDLTGKLVRTVPVSNNAATIGLQGIAAGVYLVKYDDGSQTHTVRLTKQ